MPLESVVYVLLSSCTLTLREFAASCLRLFLRFFATTLKRERALKSFFEYTHRGDTRPFARIDRRQRERLPKARRVNYFIVTSFAIVAELLARRSYVSIIAAYRCYRTFLGRKVSAKRSDRTRKNPRRCSYKGFEKKADGMSARPPSCYKVESRWTSLRQKMNGTSETCCTE